MKYKVGDRVKIVKNYENAFEIGEIAKIDEIDNSCRLCYHCENSNNSEWLKEEEITPFDYTWEDFLKAPIGTKVTFESGDILVKYFDNGFTNYGKSRRYDLLEGFKDVNGWLGKIIKIEEPIYQTVYEPTEQVEEMTMEEVCKALGKNIKIVKEK